MFGFIILIIHLGKTRDPFLPSRPMNALCFSQWGQEQPLGIYHTTMLLSPMVASINGQQLLDFEGLTSSFNFKEETFCSTTHLLVLIVVGKIYRDLRSWSEELGFFFVKGVTLTNPRLHLEFVNIWDIIIWDDPIACGITPLVGLFVELVISSSYTVCLTSLLNQECLHPQTKLKRWRARRTPVGMMGIPFLWNTWRWFFMFSSKKHPESLLRGWLSSSQSSSHEQGDTGGLSWSSMC